MDIDKFKEDIASQFLDEDRSKITIDGDFRRLDTFDSLTAMAILAIIEDEYDVNIPIDEFIQFHTVKELYEYVKSKRQND